MDLYLTQNLQFIFNNDFKWEVALQDRWRLVAISWRRRKKTADDHKYVECLKKNNNNVHTVYTQDTGVCSTIRWKKRQMYFYTVHGGIFKCRTLFYWTGEKDFTPISVTIRGFLSLLLTHMYTNGDTNNTTTAHKKNYPSLHILYEYTFSFSTGRKTETRSCLCGIYPALYECMVSVFRRHCQNEKLKKSAADISALFIST